jgi:predicted nucleic acid-binding protein
MSGASYVLDTNIILYLLNGDEWLSEMLQGSNIIISVITEMELLSFRKLNEQQEHTIRSLLANYRIIELDGTIKAEAINIRRESGLKLPDSIVAATSYITGIKLVTADKQFGAVSKLDCLIYTS